MSATIKIQCLWNYPDLSNTATHLGLLVSSNNKIKRTVLILTRSHLLKDYDTHEDFKKLDR